MSARESPLPPLDRLPSGRHRLTREAVQQSQRDRLLFAIVQVLELFSTRTARVHDLARDQARP
jgi:hypothetical protein